MTKKPGQVILPIEEAAAQERQVTIRVLTVGTKQITQTLYRQLVEEDVIDDDMGNLRGPVWGWVNLHSDCDGKAQHLHAIWEDNGQLKRSCSRFTHLLSNTYHSLEKELRDMATLYVCLVALAGKGFNHWKSDATGSYRTVKLPLRIKDVTIPVPVPRNVMVIFDAPARIESLRKHLESERSKGYYQDQIDFIAKTVKEFPSGGLKGCFDEREWEALQYCHPEQYPSHDDAYKAMDVLVDQLNTLVQNRQQSYKAIEDSGQLFVAVSGVWK